MAKIIIRAALKVAWWWKYYAACVRFVAGMTGMQPDQAKVEYWARRAITIKFQDKG